jgi:short-subunit dehydrogenase
MELSGARALVTGASGGLGAAIARALASRGARIVLSGRNEEALRRLSADLDADVFVADLADLASVDRLAADVGRVDIFVSNAALPAGGRVQTFSVEELDRALAVNLRAPIVLSRELSENMVARGRGHIVFVSSLAAAFPTPGLTAYNATKAALAAWALSLRGELAPQGVGASVVLPGPIRNTGMWADTGLPPPKGIPTRSPDQLAGAVVKAIEKDRALLSVAPFRLRAAALVARALPGLFTSVAPRLGASEMTEAMANAFRHKR